MFDIVAPKHVYPIIVLQTHGPFTRYIGMPGTFPRHRFQRKPLVSDPGMHRGTCVTHVPWCMLGSRSRGGGETVPRISGACETRNFNAFICIYGISDIDVSLTVSAYHKDVQLTRYLPFSNLQRTINRTDFHRVHGAFLTFQAYLV